MSASNSIDAHSTPDPIHLQVYCGSRAPSRCTTLTEPHSPLVPVRGLRWRDEDEMDPRWDGMHVGSSDWVSGGGETEVLLVFGCSAQPPVSIFGLQLATVGH